MSEDRSRAVIDELAEFVRWDRDDRRPRESRECLSVECPHCGAESGKRCWQTAAHRPLTHKPPIEVPHLQRRHAYRNTTVDEQE